MMLVLAVVSGESSSTAQITTAVATIVTALGGLVLAFAVLIPSLRVNRQTLAKVETVHTIVNQQRTDAQRYAIALTSALEAHGIAVPVDQSLPVAGHADAKPGQPTDEAP